MEDTTTPDRPDRPNLADRSSRRWGRSAGLLAAGLVAGGIVAGTLSANAQSPSPSASSSGSSSSSSGTATSGRTHDCHETPLTGATADKVRAAALAAVPGGTVLRVEGTNSTTSQYEAHVRKADGTEVVVRFDKAFKVTSTETRGSDGSATQTG
jgi:hypothetical protein